MDKGERRLPATLNAYSGSLHMHAELLPSPFFQVKVSPGPPMEDQASDQPAVGWKRFNDLYSRHEYADLFEGPQGTALILFKWQDNLVGVARFIDACLKLVYICI